jgi:hypothetical protein
MTQSEKLQKIVKYAVFKEFDDFRNYYDNFQSKDWIFDETRISRGEYDDFEQIGINEIIFKNSFLKAFLVKNNNYMILIKFVFIVELL